MSDSFDAIIFVDPDVEKVTIPSFIKFIASNAFSYCTKLEVIEFEDGSQLKMIGKSFLGNALVEKIVIPPHTTEIEGNALSFPENLKKIEFDENSEIKSICDFSFS